MALTDGIAPLALLVGGDMATCAMVDFLLKEMGCAVAEAAGAGNRLPVAPDADIALLVLIADTRDGGGRDAVETLLTLRRLGYQQPTVVLAHGAVQDLRRRAYALGVPDVISLPASARDLLRRLRAALGEPSRSHGRHGETIRAGGLFLRTSDNHLSDGAGWSVHLTRLETALLKALMLAPGRVVEQNALLDAIWEQGDGSGSNALAVLVRRLRAKLARSGRTCGYIHTMRGHGYVFDARAVPRRLIEMDVGTGPRVLVVDDDAATVKLIAEALQQAGYTVISGVGGEAPVLARRAAPHVILLDINMPDVDGVEVRRRLRTHPRTATIPVIAFSAGGNLRAHMREIAADDYLAKPFGIDELLLRIAKWTQVAASSLRPAPLVSAPPHAQDRDAG